MKRTLPGNLLTLCVWSLLLSSLAFIVGIASTNPLLRVLWFVWGGLGLAVTFGLYRMHRWARIAAIAYFGLVTVLGVVSLFRQGVSTSRILRVAFGWSTGGSA